SAEEQHLLRDEHPHPERRGRALLLERREVVLERLVVRFAAVAHGGLREHGRSPAARWRSRTARRPRPAARRSCASWAATAWSTRAPWRPTGCRPRARRGTPSA